VTKQGERLTDLRVHILKKLENILKVVLSPEIKEAFLFYIDKELIPETKEMMDLEKLLKEVLVVNLSKSQS